MYKIVLYDKSFTPITTLLYPYDIYDLEYTTELNKVGGASFKMNVFNTKADIINLQIYNRIKIFRGSTALFVGYIESLDVTTEEIEINCLGLLGVFKKRLTTRNINATSAPTAFYDILTDTNTSDDTGVIIGTSNVSYTIDEISLSRSNLVNAWQKIAETANNAEFKIDPDTLALDFKTSIGFDRTAEITFQYDITQIVRANVFDFDAEVTGKDTTNSVIGVGSGSITTTKQDAASIAKFGLLEVSKSFLETVSTTDLQNQTQNYVDTHKDEFYVPKIKLNPDKIDPFSFDTGDVVKVHLNNGFLNITQNVRVIKKQIVLNQYGEIEVDVDIVSEDLKNLPTAPIVGDIDNLQKRISLIEGTL